MVGKYVDLTESYKSLSEALTHAGIHTRSRVQIHYVDSEAVERDGVDALDRMDAILVPGGFGKRGVEGKIAAIRYAREHGVPYLGICLGMQLAVIEYARHEAALADANSTEFDPLDAASGRRAHHRVAEPRRHASKSASATPTWAARCASARSRATSFPARSRTGSTARRRVSERHRHRYEVNNHYLPRIEAAGLTVGAWAKSATAGDLCEMIELPRASVVLRLPVPSRIHVESAARPSAVRELRARRDRAPEAHGARQPGHQSPRLVASVDEPLRLRRRSRSPVLPDRRPLRRRIAATADGCRRRAEGDLRRPRHSLHLQVVVRQGESQLACVVSRSRHGGGAAHPRRRAQARRACRC